MIPIIKKHVKSFLIFYVLLSIISCGPPTSVNSMKDLIIKDCQGKTYKIQREETALGRLVWTFKYPVTVITQENDTIVEWRYYD